MSEDLLKKAIKNNEIGSLYLFYGPEEYLKRNYADYIETKLLSEELKLLNKIVLEGKASVPAIIDNCETLPVFSERKVVVVKNSGLFKGKKKEGDSGKKGKASKSEDALSAFLQNVPAHVCLIFIEAEIDKRIKYVDLIKKQGLIVEFNYRKPEEMAAWIVKRMRGEGFEIDLHTAAQLADYCEQGMDDVSNEIDKLCAYAGSRQKITSADIEKVCTKSVKSRVFDLTDAIAAKQCARALSLLNDMVVLKEPMPKVMYMIARQFRQLLQVKLLDKEGAGQSEITSRLGLNPYVSGKILRQAKSFSVEKLEAAVAMGLELDLAIKTGKLEDRAAVELMITSMAT
jgi:DNA polymerase-3 subunit delta